MNILEFLSEFKRKIILSGDSQRTAKVYCNCIGVFMNHYKDRFTSPLHISTRDIEDYIISLIEKKRSTSYINQFIASAKRFYKINEQPQKCSKIEYHHREQKTPNILTYHECMAMCEANIYIKQKAVINLLYWGALRRSELLNLKIKDISKDRRITIVDAKFHKSRVITIPQPVLDLLRKYYQIIKPTEYLFNGDCGRLQYSEKSVENIIKNTAYLCGIRKRVYPHHPGQPISLTMGHPICMLVNSWAIQNSKPPKIITVNSP